MSTSFNIGTEYDILKFMDSHLVMQVVEFHLNQNKDESNKENILNYKKELLNKTYLFELQEKITTEESELEKITKSKEQLAKYEDDLKFAIRGFLNLIENFRKNGNFDTSASIHKKIIDETSVNKVLEYSNILYETGRYAEAKMILSDLYKISKENKKNLIKVILALWKIFAINILTDNWVDIFNVFENIQKMILLLKLNLEEEFKKINIEATDRVPFDFKHILLHRGYLLHWGLFLLKDPRSGLEDFLSLAFNEDYYTLIQSSFTYIFKYLIVFSIISKSKKNIQTLKNSFDSISYSLPALDPFVSLFESIFVTFNLEKSCTLLAECMRIMENNFFFSGYSDLFIKKCKEMILENHMKLNTSIELSSFTSLFAGNLEKTKDFINEFISINHPGSIIEERDGVVYCDAGEFDDEKYHLLKAKELFDVTANMVELLKLGKLSKK